MAKTKVPVKRKPTKASKAKPSLGPTRSPPRQGSRGASPRTGPKSKSKPKATPKKAAPDDAKKDKAALRRRAKAAHVAQLERETAALAAERKEHKARAATLESKFHAGLDRCRAHLSLIGEARLRTIDVPAEMARKGRQSGGGTPWLIVGRIVPPKPGLAYSDLYHACLAMRDDDRIRSAFGGQRLSRIQVVYLDPLVGEPRDWTLSEIGPWDVVASRAVGKTDPAGPAHESVTVRYDTEADQPTMVLEIRIWLSLITFKERSFTPK